MNLCRALLLTAVFLAPISGPAMAQSLVFDPHVDLPPSAAAPEWSGGNDPASQFDVDRARRGGLTAIGLALFVPQGERTPATLAELAGAIDYAVKRIGVDHVAISSDVNHGGGVVGWADVGETANVAAELRRRGYDDAAIAKLWGGNLLRAWQAAIDARDPAYRPAH